LIKKKGYTHGPVWLAGKTANTDADADLL